MPPGLLQNTFVAYPDDGGVTLPSGTILRYRGNYLAAKETTVGQSVHIAETASLAPPGLGLCSQPTEVVAHSTPNAVNPREPWKGALSKLYGGQESNLIHLQEVLHMTDL